MDQITDNCVKRCHMGAYTVNRVLISLSGAMESLGEYTTQSMIHGQCDARVTVTSSAKSHPIPSSSQYRYASPILISNEDGRPI